MYMSYVAHVVPLPLQFLSDVLFELVHFLTEVRKSSWLEGLPMLGIYYPFFTIEIIATGLMHQCLPLLYSIQ